MRDWRHAEKKKKNDLKEHNTVSSHVYLLCTSNVSRKIVENYLGDFSCIVILTIFSDVAEYLEEENIGLYVNSWWYITNISHLN